MKKITFIFTFLVFTGLVFSSDTSPVSITTNASADSNFFVVVPIPLYSPETGWAININSAYLYRTEPADRDTTPSIIQVSLIYSEKKQSDDYIEINHYLKGNEYMIKGILQYKKYPDKFFGIGNSTLPDLSENYTVEYEYFLAEGYKKIIPGLYAGLRYVFQNNAMLEILPSGLMAAAPGSRGLRQSGAGILLKWDTRDYVYYATDGALHQISFLSFGPGLGSQNIFNKFEADFRWFFKTFENQSGSVQAYAALSGGDVPFFFMPYIGGDKMLRGYYKGRFRENNMISLQAEYHFHLFDLFILTLHAAAGEVMSELTDFSTSGLKYSAGAGLRFILEPKDKLTARFDIGFTPDSMGVYLMAGEAY